MKIPLPRLPGRLFPVSGREEEEPIRSELFSAERLEQHAESLASAQPVTPRPGVGRLLAPRLRDNGRLLLAAYRSIGDAIREERSITPAAEWLVDNFHIVEEQIREIRDDLPRGYYRELPKLADGPLEGYPRVFGIAWAYVAHTDSRFDPDSLVRFVRAYQGVQPLTIGELWAVAITLRIVLVENLTRIAGQIERGRAARRRADVVVDHILAAHGVPTGDPRTALEHFGKGKLSAAFAVQLVQRLRDQDPAVTPAVRWLDERLASQGTTADEVVREEHQRQGAMNVTVRNVITSMRLISGVDWADLFESVSLVDATLRAASDFCAMDFPTRDRYRHAIEELARGSRHSELEIARLALLATRDAREAPGGGEGDVTRRREADPGYVLIAKGRPAFEASLDYRVPARVRVLRLGLAAGIFGYASAIALVSIAILALALSAVGGFSLDAWTLVLLALAAVIPASDTAVALVNQRVTRRFGALALPGLELTGGVPPEHRTMIVVPTLFSSAAEVEEQVERLEVRFLACAEGDMRFALLSDFADSPTETAPGDDELLALAVAAVARLNRLHEPPDGGPRFLLLHRRRLWNAAEGKWIGWERKRGKLHELNRLLRGATDTSFVGAGPEVPSGVRYVITLDADTRLPRGAARQLVGKMVHPLNRPRFDAALGRVVEGYGVMQPRVTPTLPTGRDGSVFQRVFAGPSGIDPYAFAVSDVYQDLLGEGSYTGKGIYDVDAFEAALAGRIPENTLLSHDLLEGTFARAALVSDIEVVEEFPSRYDVSAARQHRWARGDWQLLPWIVGRGCRGGLVSGARAVPLVGRWKMLDNLRRTLSAPAVLLALVAGWTLAPAQAAAWSAAVVAMIALPAFLPFLAGIRPQRPGISKRSHLRGMAVDFTLAVTQVTLQLAFLAHQAWLMTDAIGRTLLRMFVTRRHLLEWLTAAQAKFCLPLDVRGFYRRMAGGVVAAALLLVFVATRPPGTWVVALPFVLLWMLAPAIAQFASRPPSLAGPAPVAGDDATSLRVLARRTWCFFETFVTTAENCLPPDNFQEEPSAVVAGRTSPTNIGLYLLSTVAAHDFGWIGGAETAARIGATFATLGRLERFRGHFFNWYDTRDLRPLDPRYVSSVDSGNLAGHLVAVGNACREAARSAVVHPRWAEGIEDAVTLTRRSLDARIDARRTQTVTRSQLQDALELLSGTLRSPGSAPREMAVLAAELAVQADAVVDIASTLGDEGDAVLGQDDVRHWSEAVRAAIHSHARDLDGLMPWARLDVAPVAAVVGAADLAMLDGLLDEMPTLAELAERCTTAVDALMPWRAVVARPGARALDEWIDALGRSARAATALERRWIALAESAAAMFAEMEFGFLLDPSRQLLSIGYQVLEGSLDPNCYDLLASEARLASFVAIAKGDVPARHWFRLGRALTPVDRGSALISWSGSMFEYLMPSLVMRAPGGSLLEQTARFVVRRQVQYGAELGVPWGVSESAYNGRDLEFTYQYSNFGVPGLGLKRGLSEDTVIAPYATALAAMVDPVAAARNFARLEAAGAVGRYGFREALDYTATRLPEGETVAVVKAWMAHHQGMTIVAIANALHDGAMRSRFHAEPIIQATELLLQERTPRDVAVARPRAEEVKGAAEVHELAMPVLRRFHSPHGLVPRTHLLSNGRYAVMLTAAGSGYSRWSDLAVTRWREDVTGDAWGSFVYLRDLASGHLWSAGYQPTAVEADSYEVEFAEGRAEIIRRDGSITTTLKVVVSAEDDAEVRHVSLTNLGSRVREIELTSYAEVVLAAPAADSAHQAFSKLFVETEFVEHMGVLLATRRRRTPSEPEVWAAHLCVVQGETLGDLQFETDRARFTGRGRDLRSAISMLDGQALSNTVGTVLDPVFSLRRRISLPPGGTVRVAFWTLVAPSRREALDLADKHQDATAFERAVTLAWTQAQVQLRHLGCAPEEAWLFQRLANHVIYSNPALRPSSTILARNAKGASTLWAHSISGDLPIVLVRIEEADDLEIVRQLLRAHQYWRMKQLPVDLVILNERPGSYAQDLQAAVDALVRTSQSRPRGDGEGSRGSVFVLRADQVATDVRTLLQSAARVVLLSRRGSLFEQLKHVEDAVLADRPTPALSRLSFPLLLRKGIGTKAGSAPVAPAPPPALAFFNGLGGFADDGREYVTTLGEGQWTPAPWINVVANPAFGFQVSTEGGCYSWSVNSRRHQLTPWSNDPVGDRPGEAIYVRDEESAEVWTPTALPIRETGGVYRARHGQGYSVFERTARGIALELTQYVPVADPVKISRLKIRNLSSRTRRLSVTAYVEWVLGSSREGSAPFVVTEVDAASSAMLARNPWDAEFGGLVAFADLLGRQTSWTGDRTAFLGRNGSLEKPAALVGRGPLTKRVGAGLDPCGALQASIVVEPNREVEVVFLLGEASSRADALALVARYRKLDLDEVLVAAKRSWDDLLGKVQVKTPDAAMDLMLNRWLLYQATSCRLFARSAFYQASGAYGFRDQLQDSMALMLAAPTLAREHLLRASSRQFVEGDVQHWWLPPSGQGVRTRISDDRAWLAFATARYLDVTGDDAVLDERTPFLEGPTVRPGDHDAYYQPMVSDERVTLYEHGARGLDGCLAVGAHGLPLIGTGDWNDGMNRVGEDGRGESVWLGWFFFATLSRFAPVAEARGDLLRAKAWRRHAADLRDALEREAWDGDWYRRGYFDDGTPLGSASSDECRIDSIAQSWSVISGAAAPERAALAMEAVDRNLVKRDDGLVLLFTPPFAHSAQEPGYIKGYPAGIRENGGQYTHAATWNVIAWAMLGDGDRAAELFSMLNPIRHAATRATSHRYKVEPYVASADVYSEPPHTGRGGWTWYTGSAGWLHRAGLEFILGLKVEGETLRVDPCVPKAWAGFAMTLRHRSARYEIAVENPASVSRGVVRVELDGVVVDAEGGRIALVDDGATHAVRVVLG